MSQRLLAINFGGIGDEILFLPTLASVREAFPDLHITLLLEPRAKAVQEITNLVDEIKLFDIKKRPLLPKDYFELLNILRNGNYQIVISSGSSPLVACLLFISGIKKRIGYDSGPLSRLLLTRAIPLNKNQYAANMYHDLVQGLGLKQKAVIPKAEVSQNNIASMQKFLNGFQHGEIGSKKRIIIHPGASKLAIKKGIIKTWSAQNWAALISQLLTQQNIEVILAGGPDDEETIAAINKQLDHDLNSFISAYGATRSLADLAALISIGDLLVCVDSAPMHIAVALSKPVLALFGPTKANCLLPSRANVSYLQTEYEEQAEHVVGVQLQPNTVYQSVLDLLRLVKDQ